jgi:hypothetical protein
MHLRTGYSHLLSGDRDKYGISPCDEKKWVVIGLSEDVLVTSVALANFEKYSSMLKEFQLLASTSYPTEKWINLGVYEAQPRLGEQFFIAELFCYVCCIFYYLYIHFLYLRLICWSALFMCSDHRFYNTSRNSFNHHHQVNRHLRLQILQYIQDI